MASVLVVFATRNLRQENVVSLMPGAGQYSSLIRQHSRQH